MSEKYLFLYLKTGGGHLAPAKAVAGHIKECSDREIDISLVDGFAEAPSLIKKIIEDGYSFSQSRAKWIFESLYALNKIPPVAKLVNLIVSAAVKPYLKKVILENGPKKIVIFHFFLIKPVFDILEEQKMKTPVITVVTDPYSAHPIWFIQKKQNFVVFSEDLKSYSAKRKVPEDNVKVFPFIVDRKFSVRPSGEMISAYRKKHGFSENGRIILIIGGGDGIPRGKSILKKILKSGIDSEIAIVCGRNEKLKARSAKLKEKYKADNLKIFGFIDFVHELISISDLVITKCGASTFMEILLTGKVPLINNYIWEQEKGNVQFVTKNKMGVYEKRVRKIPKVLNSFFSDSEGIKNYQNNIDKAGLKSGTAEVSEYIVNFDRDKKKDVEGKA
ncbi:MAG: MGDG synthase family glycosyltransferase [Fibrobacterota bacterium]